MPRKTWMLRAAGALVALCLLTSALASDQGAAARYTEHVKKLTAPAMEGRGADTKGIHRATRYLEREFRRLGLKPAGEQGSYLQSFQVTTGARLERDNRLAVAGKSYKVEQDYTPLSFSSSGDFKGALVFAGYGISAPEAGYDDYTHFDVKDKVVLMLRGEPEGLRKKAGRDQPTQHGQIVTKVLNAKMHGAKAVVLVNTKPGEKEEDLLLKFGAVSGPRDAGIAVLHVKRAVADEWLKAGGKSLAALQEAIDTKLQPESFAANVEAAGNVAIRRTHARVHNVLGYLPGESEEYIILGAHYDHLGRGGESSLAPSQVGQVHPGADDNASGTAALLELARHFTTQKQKPRRGILFMLFAGEEIGLLGSGHWVANPTLPLDKAVAMLNLDMVGRIRDQKLYIGGIGTGSTFQGIVEAAAKQHGFTLQTTASGYSASDHVSFLTKRIPVLFFFSGLHGDYHKPSDTWEKIDAQAATKLVALVADIATRIDSAAERPQFVRVAEATPPAGGGGGGYGPYFGSIPDFAEIPDGVKFADVRPGSPADKAGLKPGDILIQYGDTGIKNLYDFTFALRKSKVGDVVEVTVLRDGKEVKTKVTLEQRR